MADTNITGRWIVESWEQRYDDGRIAYPLGKHVEGFIQYQADGLMLCMLSRADRAPFVKGGQWNAPDDEKAMAYSSFLAYAGSFTVDGDLITHHVDLSLFPNWKGGDQKRKFRLNGTRLEILARLEEATPEARTAVLTWTKQGT